MEVLAYLRAIGALAATLGLLVGALWAMRRFNIRLPNMMPPGAEKQRLSVVNRLAVDTQRQLLLIRRDDVEHLLLIGPGHATVIESNRGSAERAD